MNPKVLSITAILLWLVSVLVGGFFFVNGQTKMGTDERVSVQLKADERNFVLAEMRMLLDGVQRMTAGLAADDMPKVAAAARAVGTASAADVNPALMLKLPLAFKQQGMAVHKQFDQIADKIDQGAAANEILLDLSEQLGACVACHSIYRLDVDDVQDVE